MLRKRNLFLLTALILAAMMVSGCAKKSAKIKSFLGSKAVKRVIAVPGKLVNIVV